MDNSKNLLIIVLSLIIIVQSVILVRLLVRRRPAAPGTIAKETTDDVSDEGSRPAPKPEAKKTLGSIAIVLDDWGYNLKNKTFVADSKLKVTLSILPFRAYSTQIAESAHENNKEVIIHMPMEPEDRVKYGLEENTILVGMEREKILELLNAAFESVPYANGLSNHMGSKAMKDANLMKVLFEFLKEKGLFFLDSVVTSKSISKDVGRRFHVGLVKRDVFIDNENKPDYIKKQLFKLARLARRRGVAVGIGHDRPTTTAVLREVMPELEEEGFRFIRLSEVVRRGEHVYVRDRDVL